MTGHYRIHYEYLLKQNGLNSSRRGTLEALTHTLSWILYMRRDTCLFVIFYLDAQFLYLFFAIFFRHLYRLKILNARLSDSGNYSCVPTSGESSSVMVHVINGECWWGERCSHKCSTWLPNKSNNAKIVFDFSLVSLLLADVNIFCVVDTGENI